MKSCFNTIPFYTIYITCSSEFSELKPLVNTMKSFSPTSEEALCHLPRHVPAESKGIDLKKSWVKSTISCFLCTCQLFRFQKRLFGTLQKIVGCKFRCGVRIQQERWTWGSVLWIYIEETSPSLDTVTHTKMNIHEIPGVAFLYRFVRKRNFVSKM